MLIFQGVPNIDLPLKKTGRPFLAAEFFLSDGTETPRFSGTLREIGRGLEEQRSPFGRDLDPLIPTEEKKQTQKQLNRNVLVLQKNMEHFEEI